MSGQAFLQPLPRPLLLAHRGDSAAYPENTLLAFRQAIHAGADGVELDVMCCGTGEVVVVHDDDTGRVTGQKPGSGLWVRRTPLVDLRTCQLGSGQALPTLLEVLEELGPRVLVNIELKSPEVKTPRDYARLRLDDGLAAATLLALRRINRPLHHTLISSFDPFQLWRLRKLLFESEQALPLGYLFHADEAWPLRQTWPARLLALEAIHPHVSLVDAVAMRAWRRGGYAVHVWTADDPREIAALSTLGVDAIITNNPGAARAALDRVMKPLSLHRDMHFSP